ncbi:hypothetical protein M3147_16345 [Agromyces mediolanus]|uniref:hypothetical protein n=1 Tax=Agromyces mediolanus TaxID=41986 RepID=UPI00203EBDE7|nr:hypothetical protein [Agromyces mediolanus]MCM3658828.1 hypothetical protein [Agromyces mediolanus]
MPEPEYEPRRARRAKIALAVAGALTIAAVGGGAAFAMTSAAVVAEHEAEAAQLVELPPVTAAPPTEVPPTDGVEAPAGAGVSDASSDAEFPVYDADTDIATIPRPADDPDPANTEIWLTQQRIIAQCMREQGFEHRYAAYWLASGDPVLIRDALGNPSSDEYLLALWGDTGAGDDYHWEEAGCHGYAVHVTGMDDAN